MRDWDAEREQAQIELDQAMRKVEIAADLWRGAAILYLAAGQEAERLGELALARFSIAYGLAAWATGAGLKANAELRVAAASGLAESIVTAIREHNDERRD